MGNLTNWFQPEPTKKAIYEGIYPVTIIAARVFTKDKEVDNKTIQREVAELTFKTLGATQFPDGPQDKIIVSQQYYFDVPMHQNALNGIARAFGIDKMEDTSQFEGKVGIVGIINREYEANDGTKKYIPQLGEGLFSYAPMAEGAKIDYLGNHLQSEDALNKDKRMEWFKNTLANYRQPK